MEYQRRRRHHRRRRRRVFSVNVCVRVWNSADIDRAGDSPLPGYRLQQSFLRDCIFLSNEKLENENERKKNEKKYYLFFFFLDS